MFAFDAMRCAIICIYMCLSLMCVLFFSCTNVTMWMWLYAICKIDFEEQNYIWFDLTLHNYLDSAFWISNKRTSNSKNNNKMSLHLNNISWWSIFFSFFLWYIFRYFGVRWSVEYQIPNTPTNTDRLTVKWKIDIFRSVRNRPVIENDEWWHTVLQHL